jgi:chromosome segregation ATPase
MPTLREALTVFVEEVSTNYETKLADLETRELVLKNGLADLEKARLDHAEQVQVTHNALTNREDQINQKLASVSSIANVAAERKSKIKVLEDNQKELVAQKQEAEAKTRVAEKEKVRLESVIHTLTGEKAELRKRLAIAGGELPEEGKS